MNQKKIVEILTAYKEKTGMSWEAIARELFVPIATLTRWLKSQTRMSPAYVELISKKVQKLKGELCTNTVKDVNDSH